MADYRRVKRMRAEKHLRDKEKKNISKSKKEDKKPKDPEAVEKLIELWKKIKEKKNG